VHGRQLFRGEKAVGAPVQSQTVLKKSARTEGKIRKVLSILEKDKNSEGLSPRVLEAEKGFQGLREIAR
jgi:hypothetical protein